MKAYRFLFDFHPGSQLKSLPRILEVTLNLDFWERLEQLRLWGLLGMDWMHFALRNGHKPSGGWDRIWSMPLQGSCCQAWLQAGNQGDSFTRVLTSLKDSSSVEFMWNGYYQVGSGGQSRSPGTCCQGVCLVSDSFLILSAFRQPSGKQLPSARPIGPTHGTGCLYSLGPK